MKGGDRIGTKEAVRTLLPFLEAASGEPLAARVETAPLEQLRRFYLFSVSGLVVPQEEDDLPRFIERRFLSALSAAHRAGWTVLTVAVGSSSGVEIHLGFMTESRNAASEPYVFERILRGLLPGLGVRFVEDSTVESFLSGKTYGGIVAGVPALKIDDERQRFSLPSVIRSLHGEDYALLMVSRPVRSADVAKQLQRVWKVKDDCHSLGLQTIARETGGGETSHRDVAQTESNSYSATEGYSLILVNGSESEQYSIGTSVTTGLGEEKHWSESISTEEQNSVALELERLAQRQADRLMKAANIGEWETAITFATRTMAGRDILAGSLLGELAKPSTDVFPPRIYYGELDGGRPLLLPGLDNMSEVFPRSLASYLTGEELASIAAPPVEQLPGYDIRRIPTLSLTDAHSAPIGDRRVLGLVCDHGRPLDGVHVEFGPEDLTKHLFVCGLTGSGKTTTVKELLTKLPELRTESPESSKKSTVPFLVLESAKRDYRQLLGVASLSERLKVYTVGDGMVSPLRMNPFFVMPGISALSHIDFLKAIFNASFSLYGPMPYILEKCIHNVYLKRGWNLTTGRHPLLCDKDGDIDAKRYQDTEVENWFPTLLDLKEEVQHYVRTVLEYRGELSDNIRTAIVTRLESLSVGAKGLLFGTSKALDIEELLQHPTVLELEALSDDDDKAFFVGLILTFISEYRQCKNPALNPLGQKALGLRHLLVIEEAHRLLKNVVQERQTEQLGNPRGKAVEFFANVISEMRAMGQGVVVVEQIPTKILPDVIKNTNAKIVHRLVAGDDQALISSSLGLTPEEAIYLTSLKTGHALYLKEGMQRPVEVKIIPSVRTIRISHEKVNRSMHPDHIMTEMTSALAAEIRNILASEGDTIVVRTLCSLATTEESRIADCIKAAMSEVKTALLVRDRTFTPQDMAQYVSNRLVSFLVLGVFHLEGDAMRGISADVTALVNGEAKSAVSLRRRLAAGWGVTDSRQGASYRIRELVLDRAIRAGLNRGDEAAINKIAGTYFLIDVPEFRQELVAQVSARLGGEPWTQ